MDSPDTPAQANCTTANPTDAGERFTAPVADRPPTAEEALAAERAATDVDQATVAEHFERAIKTGAAVQGEGQIEARENQLPVPAPAGE
jgi:hypothetical protein